MFRAFEMPPLFLLFKNSVSKVLKLKNRAKGINYNCFQETKSFELTSHHLGYILEDIT